MADSGEPISHEFYSERPPLEVIRAIVAQSGDFGKLGYQVETHTPESVILARRFVPALVYRVPLGVALLLFIWAVMTPSAASNAGRIAGICVVVAALLSLVVKATERLTLSASPEGRGSRVLISGTAIPQMRRWATGTDDQESNESPAEAITSP